ncbi:ABC transporter ATP-binding protein [Kocuria sp.]|uniref:ABC transporter ATP-binding protein n=1 Tax=Kocuria sp. TaxID=1871328 RepID=UPI0026DF81B5|nr:ABC transporter ATP-binding protein [Kocuria sp.]MDO5619008.1 ABC transporter ATP-binding protein [Kocuria sp.]
MTYPILQALNLTQRFGPSTGRAGFTGHRRKSPVASEERIAPAHPTVALDNLSVTILRGQSVAIMGPSGSGKTTLLHALAGIDLPQSGEIYFHNANGPDAVHLMRPEARADLRLRHFGFVFQSGLMLDELTVVENVALPLMLCGVDRASAYQTASSWLQRLGLEGLEDRRLGEISGGQAQRVAIARAQVCGPEVIFADEPTGALDSAAARDVLNALLESTTQRGATLVLVTHDPTVAAQCSRTIHLRDGKIVGDTRDMDSGPDAVECGGLAVSARMRSTQNAVHVGQVRS